MGQEVTTKDGRAWWLEPGALFLDLVYTGDLGTGDPWWERLHDTHDLDRWLAVHVSEHLTPSHERDLAEARSLRAALGRLAIALPRGGPLEDADLRHVVRAASRPDVPPVLPACPMDLVPARRALSTIARDAVVQLRDRPERFKVCGADDCPIVFVDTSRTGTREWCSMARCGNREKARRFATRKNETS